MPAKKITTRQRAAGGAAVQKSPQKKATEAPPLPDVEAGAWVAAVRAAESKKADSIRVLDLRPVTSFADFLIICSGSNPRQIQAIAEEVELQLKKVGERPKSIEGYQNAEWILMDYGDYVVNIFSEQARGYYDLERLWRDANVVAVGT